ncbi:MAG: hypothetical protein JST11_31445, partial [Acidobacteria bacterium]|nr:hypothetical protein [Acidobacteriota bacterium]
MNDDSQRAYSPIRHGFLSERGRLNFPLAGGLLAFVTASGLAVWLMRFSGFSQIVVLFHTLIGVIAAAAFAVWQLSHWLGTRKAPRKPRKIAAYIGFWLLAASAVSGFVVTWQGLFGLYMSHAWSRFHLWTSVLAVPFLAYHMLPGREEAAAALAPGRRRMWKGAAGVAAALTAITVLIGTLAVGNGNGGGVAAPAAALGENPFAPSNAATDTGRPLAL